jgi:predicted Zn-dependent peptidase
MKRIEQKIETHVFPNGLTLIVEPMDDVQSAAFSMLVPSGSVFDPPGQNGSASVLSDLITRGAGPRDSKALSAALDNLGVQHDESVGSVHLGFTGASLAENLAPALKIYGDVVLRPHLPADQFEAAREGVAQALTALEDEPRQKIMIELRRRCYSAPWGLPTEGDLSDLPALTADSVRAHYERCFRPNDAILVAGKVDFQEVRDLTKEVFGGWRSKPAPGFNAGPRGPARDHIEHESTQTHIGIAYDAVPYRDPDYYAAWAAVSVLSGGMSARLFTEVREKRGLCYSVQASLNSLKDDARVLCYAGTTSERAQKTLDVTVHELKRLGEGIEEEELARCKARAKTSLIMQQESSIARSSSIARDWYHLGRVTTLDEVRSKIDALTVASVLDYVHRHPAGNFTMLTIGPQPLEEPSAFLSSDP